MTPITPQSQALFCWYRLYSACLIRCLISIITSLNSIAWFLNITSLFQVLLGLLSVWNVSFLGYSARVSIIILFESGASGRLIHTIILNLLDNFRQYYPILKHWRNSHLIFNRHVTLTCLLVFYSRCQTCDLYQNLIEFRSVWRVMGKEYLLMVSLFLMRLVKLILVNQGQMANTAFTN